MKIHRCREGNTPAREGWKRGYLLPEEPTRPQQHFAFAAGDQKHIMNRMKKGLFQLLKFRFKNKVYCFQVAVFAFCGDKTTDTVHPHFLRSDGLGEKLFIVYRIDTTKSRFHGFFTAKNGICLYTFFREYDRIKISHTEVFGSEDPWFFYK